MNRLPWVACAVALVSCGGGSDGPTGTTGVFEIASYQLTNPTVDCGPSKDARMIEIASPDTAIAQLHLVNTRSVDITVTKVEAYGTVLTSSTPTDVGAVAINRSDLPFSPEAGLVVAKTGDVLLRVSVPMGAVCNSKPYLYAGEQQIMISIRLTTSSGSYVTIPNAMTITWDRI